MIRTLLSETVGDRTVSLYEITPETARDPEGRYRAWSFTCDRCGDICSALTEADARDELRDHVCPVTEGNA